MKIKVYFKGLLVGMMALSMLSCENLLDANSEMKIKAEDHYSTIGEVYGGFIGLYASFRAIAEKTIVLSGLKGDLLQPTQNAPEDYWRVFRYEAGTETTVNNAQEYYDVVINCNDFLKRVIAYNQGLSGEIPANVYKGMISQAVTFKVWCLMTAGKLFGEARYYDLVVSGDSEEGMYTLKLEDLPDFLMAYMQGGEDGVSAFNDLDWAVLLGNTGTNIWPCRNISADALYGELCLWGGHYQEAVDRFIGLLSPSKDLSLNLSAFKSGDWYKMFLKNIDRTEMISVFIYNANNRQENKLLDYFSYEYPHSYYFAPTQHALDYFESEMLNESNSFRLGDKRGSYTYRKIGGQLAVCKYDMGTSDNEYASDHYIHLYRAGGIHLMLAEALCFMHNYDAALAVLDEGIVDDYYVNNGDKSYWKAPFEKLFTAFSGNKGGIRNRVQLQPLDRAEVFKGCLTSTDSVTTVAGRIADEVARELAFEGQRWFTLVRMAKHLNNPDFLAERVALKFGEGGSDSYRALLKNEKNWFIK